MRRAALVIAFGAVAGSLTVGEERSLRRMVPVEELFGTRNMTNFPLIQRGQDVLPHEFDATLVYRRNGQFLCTATAVGPKVVLTAAHCLPAAQTVSAQAEETVEVGGAQVNIHCKTPPDYVRLPEDIKVSTDEIKRENSKDIAVCVADEPLKLPYYEYVIGERGYIKNGDLVRLVGFGRVQCNEPTTEPAATLQKGLARVLELFPRGLRYIVAGSDIIEPQIAVICRGDSGGAAFADYDAYRMVVGINSATDEQSISYLTEVADPEVQAFIRTAASGNGICGLDEHVPDCRGPEQNESLGNLR